MIEIVFTLDYEIYGNGTGSLRDLVYEPTEKLKAVFLEHGARFVVFVEAAELEMIGSSGSDDAAGDVTRQIRELHREGFEIGLHLHPQWYGARRVDGAWRLDYGEYNLCALPRERMAAIIDRSIAFLRRVLDLPDFLPLSFRAGNWLLQPTTPVAEILAERGLRIDSSVFKGGIRRQHGLDYRPALRNGYYWPFKEDVTAADPGGRLIEFPIFTKMVPPWRILSLDRIGLEARGSAGSPGVSRLYRVLDTLRLAHPMKLDFCRLSAEEFSGMVQGELARDRKDPGIFRPLVAIGHSKEFPGVEPVDRSLSQLRDAGILVRTFRDWDQRLSPSKGPAKRP